MKAGVIPVEASGDSWTLQANAPTWRPVDASRVQLAEMLGLVWADVGESPLWVNAGSDQLVIPLRSLAAVARCKPLAALLLNQVPTSRRQRLPSSPEY